MALALAAVPGLKSWEYRRPFCWGVMAAAAEARPETAEEGAAADAGPHTNASVGAASATAGGGHVALFYAYVRVPEPESMARQQRSVCASLGLTGRVRIAAEGINGLLFGTPTAVAAYRAHNDAPGSLFPHLQYKLSVADTDPFDGELFVRVASEITATGPVMQTHLPTALGGSGGRHLTPQEFHAAVVAANRADSGDEEDDGNDSEKEGQKKKKRKRVVIDTRNAYETSVGTFRGAIDPKIRTFAQFPSWVEANKSRLDGADVFMFCTGGIRCEKASGYLRSLGVAASVNQLAGGVHSYLEVFSEEARAAGLRTVGRAPGCDEDGKGGASSSSSSSSAGSNGTLAGEPSPDCLWKGVNYTFDKRFASPSAGGHGRVGKCCYCGDTWSTLDADVVCKVCKDQLLVCPTCRDACRKAADREAGRKEENREGEEEDRAEGCSVSPAADRAPLTGGVNFQRRLHAEAASVYLCVEHNILSDTKWRTYLDDAAAHARRRGGARQEARLRAALTRIHRQIGVQVAHSKRKGRQGRARRRRFQTQMERVGEWLGLAAVAGEEIEEDDWVPFFPLLNLWEEV